MNPNLNKLQAYPFEKLAGLKAGIQPPSALKHIALSIGEPKHEPPGFVLSALQQQLDQVSKYAATRGTDELRKAIATWAHSRFGLTPATFTAERHILPVNGTREALFAIAQACVDTSKPNAKVLMPNPFYQIYEGAALLAGAEPVFINCDTANLMPDFASVSEQDWRDCQLLYICSPGNPSGAVFELEDFKTVLELADKYDFMIASDECYSELYFDEDHAPMGLLEACAKLGRNDYKRCLVFHSLSKRSNLPGLRSGFVAGDAEIIEAFYAYRTYHGCAMSLPVQYASIAAWQDEAHVKENRIRYLKKFEAFIDILKDETAVSMPDAGFYIWLNTQTDDCEFTRDLFAQQNVTVLPGSYLARDTASGNPGKNRVRIALVATLEEVIEAAKRIKIFLATNR